MYFKSTVLSVYIWRILLLIIGKNCWSSLFQTNSLKKIHIIGCLYSERVFSSPYYSYNQYQVFTLSPTSDLRILCKQLSFLWRFQLWDKLYQTLFCQILLWWMAFKSAVLSLYIWWIFLLRFVKLVNIVEVIYPSLKQIHIIGGLYSLKCVFRYIFIS